MPGALIWWRLPDLATSPDTSSVAAHVNPSTPVYRSRQLRQFRDSDPKLPRTSSQAGLIPVLRAVRRKPRTLGGSRRFTRLPQPWWQRPDSGGGSELDAELHCVPQRPDPRFFSRLETVPSSLVRTNPAAEDAERRFPFGGCGGGSHARQPRPPGDSRNRAEPRRRSCAACGVIE